MAQTDKRYFWRNDDPLWYKDAVMYELHVRAFRDSNGDGVGDFAGLIEKLDYLQDLGITTIWLLPFYPSPFRDDGYDVENYTDVHPSFGSIADFRQFIREANYRGLRVITELVVNHTSDQHPWFQKARRAAPGSPGRNFYVWSDTQNRYREARVIFKDSEHSNWAWDPVAEAYYWHRFYSHQPDLNFDNPNVRHAILKVMDFWLRMGVSGVRLDAIPYLYEREGTSCENLPETHEFLRELRRQLDTRFTNRMLLAEANQWAEDAVAYFGDGDECHMSYHFPLMPRMFMAIRMEDRFPIIDILEHTPAINNSCQWALFLRNHDELTLEMVTDEERDYMYRVFAQDSKARLNLGIRRRLAPLLSNDRNKMELMNGLLFSLPGTPIIYYGDEIGMGDNYFLGDRQGVRTPMQWSADRNAGFSQANPHRLYLPVNIDPEYHYEAVNVEAQQANPDSFLWWMKRLIALRKRYRAFGRGSIDFLQPENRKVLAFVRSYGEEKILVVANLARHTQFVSLDLSSYTGRAPVELFGNTEFPAISEEPYFITLGPYSFYWFALEPARTIAVESKKPSDEGRLPDLGVLRDHHDLFRRKMREPLEKALLDYVRGNRWFGSKSRVIQSASILDVIPWVNGPSAVTAVLVEIRFAEGEPETYLVPVAAAFGPDAAPLLEENRASVFGVVRTPTGAEGIVYDAVVSGDFRDHVLRTMAGRRSFRGSHGTLSANYVRGVYRRLRGTGRGKLESRLLTGEQSNTSAIFEDRFKLKLYRRVEPGMSPELEMGRYLTENHPFLNTAPVAGYCEYRGSRTDEPLTLAILHGFVANEGDAWTYTLDALGHYFEAFLTHPDADGLTPVQGSLIDLAEADVPPLFAETAGSYLAAVHLLGTRTAEMHLALAADDDNPDFNPELFSMSYQRALFHGMRGSALQVLQLLRKRVAGLPEEARELAKRIIAAEPQLMANLHALTEHRLRCVRTRCHGDYHLGQVLFTGSDFVIIDFEGEPGRHLGERRIKRSPLQDVAGMLRSFQYASMVALRGRPPTLLREEDLPLLQNAVREWNSWTPAAFLRAYLDAIGDAPVIPRSRESLSILLNALLLDKAFYEVRYELNNRPDWVAIPLEGIVRVLNLDGPED